MNGRGLESGKNLILIGDLYTHLGYIPTPSIHWESHPHPQQFPKTIPSLPDHSSNQQHSPSPRPKGPRVPPEKTQKIHPGKKNSMDSRPPTDLGRKPIVFGDGCFFLWILSFSWLRENLFLGWLIFFWWPIFQGLKWPPFWGNERRSLDSKAGQWWS